MIATIARQQLRRHLVTPMLWLLLALAQFFLAWLLFSQLEAYQQLRPQLVTSGSPLGIMDLVIAPTLTSTALMILALAPLIGADSIGGELRSGRIALLLSSPVTPTQLVLGKWLGNTLALLPLILLSGGMALAIGLGSSLDGGRLFTALTGLLLLGLCANALTLWLSSHTPSTGTAILGSYALLLLLWLLDLTGQQGDILWLALMPHLTPFTNGELGISDLGYFALLTIWPLALSSHRLWRMAGGE